MDKYQVDGIIEEIEQLGLDVCSNHDRLIFEVQKTEQELYILQTKRAFFEKYPKEFLRTKYGTFIAAGDLGHSEHAKHALEQKLIMFKKELKKEKISLALDTRESHIYEERHLKLVENFN